MLLEVLGLNLCFIYFTHIFKKNDPEILSIQRNIFSDQKAVLDIFTQLPGLILLEEAVFKVYLPELLLYITNNVIFYSAILFGLVHIFNHQVNLKYIYFMSVQCSYAFILYFYYLSSLSYLHSLLFHLAINYSNTIIIHIYYAYFDFNKNKLN
jgi:hypothetical protein